MAETPLFSNLESTAADQHKMEYGLLGDLIHLKYSWLGLKHPGQVTVQMQSSEFYCISGWQQVCLQTKAGEKKY